MNAQNIRDYNFTLSANATQNLDVPGDYLKVISATGAIRVRTVEGWMKDLLPGQGVKGLNFQRLILEDRSGAANTGTIAVGIGADSIVDDRITGEVSISDIIRSNCAIYTGGATTIGFTATQMVAAAANTNGLIIRSALIESIPGAGGTANVRIIAAPTAPASLSPAGAAIVIGAQNNVTAGTLAQWSDMNLRRQIPAGWGVWACTSIGAAVATSAGAVISAETL